MTTPTVTAPATAPVVPRALKTPDFTPAQIVASAGGIVALAVALGVPLSTDKQHEIILFAVVFAPVLIAVDAWIRHSRAKYLHTALLTAMGAINLAQPLAAGQGNGDQPIPIATPQGNANTQLPPYIK
jgi:hypothetical protein